MIRNECNLIIKIPDKELHIEDVSYKNIKDKSKKLKKLLERRENDERIEK